MQVRGYCSYKVTVPGGQELRWRKAADRVWPATRSGHGAPSLIAMDMTPAQTAAADRPWRTRKRWRATHPLFRSRHAERAAVPPDVRFVRFLLPQARQPPLHFAFSSRHDRLGLGSVRSRRHHFAAARLGKTIRTECYLPVHTQKYSGRQGDRFLESSDHQAGA